MISPPAVTRRLRSRRSTPCRGVQPSSAGRVGTMIELDTENAFRRTPAYGRQPQEHFNTRLPRLGSWVRIPSPAPVSDYRKAADRSAAFVVSGRMFTRLKKRASKAVATARLHGRTVRATGSLGSEGVRQRWIVTSVTPIERIASATRRPCAVRTSTCRSFATISSGAGLFLGIRQPSKWPKAIHQRGPLLRGQTRGKAAQPGRRLRRRVSPRRGAPEDLEPRLATRTCKDGPDWRTAPRPARIPRSRPAASLRCGRRSRRRPAGRG